MRRFHAATRRRSVLARGVLAAVALIAGFAAVGPARAQGVSGFFEVQGSDIETKRTDLSTPQERTQGKNLISRISINWFNEVGPSLTLRLGGLFENTDIRLDGQKSNFRRLRPYMTVQFRGVTTAAEFSFQRVDERSDTTPKTIRDTATGLLSWNPERYPNVRLSTLWSRAYDTPRTNIDQTTKLAEISADYNKVRWLSVYARSSVTQTDDDLHGFQSRNWFQTGRVAVQHSIGSRATASVDATINRQTTEARTGNGELVEIAIPTNGLSTVNDNLLDVVLPANNALIDDNFVTSAGINLGYTAPSGDLRPRQFGFDFSLPFEVERVLVATDRELPTGISGSSDYGWQVFVSEDNRIWTASAPLANVTFGPDRDHWQWTLFFASPVTSRFLKIVARPLRSGIDATNYPNIAITEIVAQRVSLAGGTSTKRTTIGKVASSTLRYRITDEPLLYYDLTGNFASNTGTPSTYAISNGLSLLKPFGPDYSLSARLAHEIGQQVGVHRTADTGSVSFFGRPLPTLQGTVVFNGTHADLGGVVNDNKSAQANVTAALFRGVDLNVLTEYSRGDTHGTTTDSRQLTVGTTLTPHRRMNLFLNYQARHATSTGVFTADLTTTIREAGATWTPFDSVYLFGSYRSETRTAEERRISRNYSVNWSPLRGGTLLLSMVYNERFDSFFSSLGRDRIVSARWEFIRRAYIDLSYQLLTQDSDQSSVENRIWVATLRVQL